MDGTATGTIIKMTDDSKNAVAEFQCRQNGTGISNLKVEAKRSNDKARIGKVPLDLLAKQMQKFSKTFNNRHQNFPKEYEDFLLQKQKWQVLFNKVNAVSKKVTTNINNNQFVDSMATFYTSNKSNAVSKLMQLTLLNEILSLQGKKKDELITDIYFLAQKKGKGFGPFGKLY
jgi:phosphopentomutase